MTLSPRAPSSLPTDGSEEGDVPSLLEQLRLYDEERTILVELATQLMLVTPDDLYTRLSELLEPLTEALDAERVMLVMLDPEVDELSCRAEWYRPGVRPAMPHMQGIPYRIISDLVDPLRGGEVLAFSDVNQLPEGSWLPAMAAKLGLPAILFAPIVSREGVPGTITAARREPRPWPERIQKLLQLAGQLIGNAVLRCDRERALRERETQLSATQDRQLKLEEQLLHAQKMESVGQLAGGVAHDFNNVLCAIRCVCDGLVAKTEIAEDVRARVGHIVDATEQAASLTRQLMAFSRKQVLCLEVVDVHHVVASVFELMAHLAGERVRLDVELDAISSNVKAEFTPLQQILMNLTANARDAMPDGGRLTVRTVNLELDEEQAEAYPGLLPGQHFRLSVNDTGHGMSPETLARVFDPFFTTKAPGRGTGLGMATVYGIVKQYGGHVVLCSKPGAGTTVEVFLPTTNEPLAVRRTEPATDACSGRGELILLVEDQRLARESTSRMLEENGYRVLAAEDGCDALVRAAECGHDVALLITDVVMPRMGGPALLAELRKTRPCLPAVFISGYAGDSLSDMDLESKHVDFLPKPYAMHSLMEKIRDGLAG